EETITALLGRLDDEEQVRNRVIDALPWHPRLSEEIRRRLKDPDAERRSVAILMARDRDDFSSVPALLNTLGNGPEAARLPAAQALVHFYVGRAAPRILALLPKHGQEALDLLISLRAPEA